MRLVFVDDDRFDADIFKREWVRIKDQAVDFLLVQNPADLFACIERYHDEYVVVVLDVNLLGESGISLLKTLRARCSWPVIMMSNSSNDVDVASAYAAGCNAYLQKPFTADENRRIVESIHQFWFSTAIKYAT